MLIKKTNDILPSVITSESTYKSRREFLKSGLYAFAGLAMPSAGFALAKRPGKLEAIPALKESSYRVDADLTDYDYITGYNNFVEFGSSKGDPAKNAGVMKTRPWNIVVDGECEKPGEIGIEEILTGFTQEERIYRLRCVEAWTMVIPWVGIPLADLLKRFQPTSRAKYVAFETYYEPEIMHGSWLDFPYREGLRIDEAMHPLTLLATGLYGEVLPNQNGAPLRLVVPWKYGFKSIKSIARISFSEKQPFCSWQDASPGEYGFYANVNPGVSHPRWSQKYHRVIGAGIFASKKRTEMFNGYADEVAHLYSGMDLKKNF